MGDTPGAICSPLSGSSPELAAPSFRILSPEGEYLGRTSRPKGSWVKVARGHLMLTTYDAETGAPRLEVYEITPAVSGLKYP